MKNNSIISKYIPNFQFAKVQLKLMTCAEFCKENRLKSIGICDSFNLCGALEFSEKISKNRNTTNNWHSNKF